MVSDNEYMRVYMARRRAERRAELVAGLGGKCVRCDSTKDLQFDHIDPTTKSFGLDGPNLDKSWKLLVAEARKCQLLCRPHHVDKTRSDLPHPAFTRVRVCCGREFVGMAYNGHKRWCTADLR